MIVTQLPIICEKLKEKVTIKFEDFKLRDYTASLYRKASTHTHPSGFRAQEGQLGSTQATEEPAGLAGPGDVVSTWAQHRRKGP